MRMWHKDLIDVLPDKQLLAQWRECCAIAVNIMKHGTPNHILVNKVMDYNKSHFYNYCCMVVNEMFNRGFNISDESRKKIYDYVNPEEMQVGSAITHDELFAGWHTERYLLQCFYNLQEKYDCDGITFNEWVKVRDKVQDVIGEVIK